MAKSTRQRTGQAARRAASQAEARAAAKTAAPAAAATASQARSDRRRQPLSKSAQQARRRSELMKWLGTGLLLVIFAVIAVIAINSRDDDSGSTGSVATVVAGRPMPEGIQQNGTVLGDPNAPLLIVEYGDYQCPFCKKFSDDDMPTLIQEYVATGKARLEYRQYPIVGSSAGNYDQSGESFTAAEGAYCAADQNLFWQMHDALYTNSVGEFKGSFTPDRVKRIAGTITGMDTTAFGTCLDSGAKVQTVLDSAAQASSSGINSTPTFVVNDRTFTGANYPGLKEIIEQELGAQ
jgi:protein-disulfide isomerase